MRLSKKFTTTALPALLCILAMLVAACGGGGAGQTGNSSSSGKTKASADKQVLRYPVIGDVTSIDPANDQDTDSDFIVQAAFVGLVGLDDNLAVKMNLASDYKVSSDNLTYTFTLKPNLKFADGNPLTADDVAYSINRTVLPATKSVVSTYLSLIKGYDKVSAGKQASLIGDGLIVKDPNTIAITITKPAPYFLQTLAYPTSFVVEKAMVEKYTKADGSTTYTDHLNDGGTSGPFKVVSYSHTTGFELVPNENFFGDKPQIQHLSIPFFKDYQGTYSAYQAHQVDFTILPPDNVATERSNPAFKETPRLTIRYAAMNYLVKPFDNSKIRQAFALAIDKNLIVQSALSGTFTPSNHVIPSGMQGYYPDLKGPDGTASTGANTAMAKQLLQEGMQEAGYANAAALPPITLTFYPRSTGMKNAETAMVQMWQNVLGVSVKTQIVTRSQAVKLTNATRGNGSLQMWIAGWNSDYPDPQDWLSTFFEKGVDYNQNNYGQNNSADAAAQQAVQNDLLKADITQDPTARMKLYNDAEQKIINDVGWIPLWQEKVQSLTRPNVQGLVLNAQLQIPQDDWAKIYITQ